MGDLILLNIFGKAYLVLDLGEGIPHLQEDWLQEPVPDVEGQRDQYAGYAHHGCLKMVINCGLIPISYILNSENFPDSNVILM